MTPTTPRRRSARRVALIGAIAALGLTAAAPPMASATADNWSCWLGSGSYCNSDRHSIRSSGVYNPDNRTSGAAASTTGGTGGLYGSWVFGGGYSCHSYSGANVLYPLIGNGSGVTGAFYGASTYGTGADSC